MADEPQSLVIPNGISRQLLGKIDDTAIGALRESLGGEVILFKMARWEPDKNWESTLKATQSLKQRGLKTVLVARGGVEPYGQEVMRDAHMLGLRVKETWFQTWPRRDYLAALHRALVYLGGRRADAPRKAGISGPSAEHPG
ncbi:MAG TPA: hypothetical protein VNP04_20710 [Alphaproteobacteria bacterium]|nr:hypothetical protein [Alphaproteobacteria bacterium]